MGYESNTNVYERLGQCIYERSWLVVDFIDRLTDRVNEIPNMPTNCRIGYLGTDESFVVYPLPGSRTVTEYMDGTKDQQLNFEFAMRSEERRVGKESR